MCVDELFPSDLSLLLLYEVSTGCGTKRRGLGVLSCALSDSFRDDFVVVSMGSGANRLTLGASCFSGECFRADFEDLVVVSMGSGAKRLGFGGSCLVEASAGTFCGEDRGIATVRANGPGVEYRLSAHALLFSKARGADQASSWTERGFRGTGKCRLVR